MRDVSVPAMVELAIRRPVSALFAFPTLFVRRPRDEAQAVQVSPGALVVRIDPPSPILANVQARV
jgi:hypothetical protein